MASILHYLKKGTALHHFRQGTFFTSACMRLLLGKSRTAHLLCSFAAQLKIKERLERQYAPALEQFDREYAVSDYTHERSSKVWVCWFQGMENAPDLVQRCYRSLQEHLSDREIVLITEKNMGEYVQLPDFILEKWKKGAISHAHLSDLLRLELLIRYGGTWIDSTVLFTGDASSMPFLFDSDLFFFQMLPPGRGGHTHIPSNWFITAATNSHVLMAVRHLLLEYWKTHDSAVDYFLFHDFMIIVLQHHPELWDKVPSMDVSLPSMLHFSFFKPYDEARWQHIRALTPLHKLTYKIAPEKAALEDTFYRTLMTN